MKNEKYHSALWMFNYYTKLAKGCWDQYSNISQAAYMFDYYSDMAEKAREIMLTELGD